MSIDLNRTQNTTPLNSPAAAELIAVNHGTIDVGDRFILDLDGTLVRGGHATQGAEAFLRAIEGRFVLVSNNSRETSRGLSSKLRRLGFDIPAERIILAGEEAIRFVAHRYPGARCLVATSLSLRRSARSHGLIPVSDNADVIVLGRDTQWSYAKLSLIANEVRKGAALVAANPDLTHPGSDGLVVPETGSLLAAVEAASGRAATYIVGKPAAALFVAALDRLGSTHANTIVIGDNPLTDQAGANALGLRSLIVHADRQNGYPNLAGLCEKLALNSA